jgi:hypothetical protein
LSSQPAICTKRLRDTTQKFYKWPYYMRLLEDRASPNAGCWISDIGLSGIKICSLTLVIVACMLLSPPAWACSIPVFQYALAYWSADPYEVIVFHRGPLSSEEIPPFLSLAASDVDLHTNVIFRTVDLAASPDEAMRELWEAQPDAELPWMVVRYPRYSRVSEDAWSGRFTAAALESLLDSPIRKEIAHRIIKGESAVWVLLESGIQQQDESAARLLETQLKKMSETLRIWVPEGIGQSDEADLSVEFSMVRLSRSDPGEQMLVQMLLHTEWDLKTIPKPMAFPIFGRGRVIYALVGDGINEDNIRKACSFLIGWCSCQVKELNPGVDLLMSVNWDDMLGEELLVYEETPLSEAKAVASETAAVVGGNSNALKRNILVAVLVQIMGVAFVTSIVLWKKRKRA